MIDLTDYMNYLRASGCSQQTVYLRSRHIKSLANHLGDLESLTFDDLIAWMGNEEWTQPTRKTWRSSLKKYWQWVELTGRGEDIAKNLPCVRIPRSIPQPALDQDIMDAIKRAEPRVKLMMELMAYCGLRRGEVCKVRGSDVQGDYLRVVGKGGHTRMVPLPGFLGHAIREKGMGYVFPGKIDGHLADYCVGKLVSNALPDGVSGHKLRHRFATTVYRNTKDIRSCQELLGHAKLDTTMIYVQVDSDTKRAAAETAWRLDAA